MTDDDAEDELGNVSDQVGGIASRFGTSETGETTEATETRNTADTTDTIETTDDTSATSVETTETGETSGATETPHPGDEEFQLREHWNGRTVYLPDDVVDDLDLRYKECSIKWQKQRGGELPKNERFYPAVIQAALGDTTIEEELGLE